ncbi:MAG: membrane protein insertion efficiency factor YidD [Methylophilales bacterium]|nr:membrane protein insertion efficiency factor YidD [Methylophilales bacterium]
MIRIFIWLIKTYRFCLSPVLGNSCRFSPSCSCYAIEALEKYGVLRGGLLTAKRLTRCHPWHAGGYDPIP